MKKLKKIQYEFYIVAVHKGIEFLIEKVNSLDHAEGVCALKEVDQMIIQKILKIINLYCLVDSAEEPYIYTLYTEKVTQMSLS